MSNIHADIYPELKKQIRKIGKDLSTPDFTITLYSFTKESEFGSSYSFQIKVKSADSVSEEERDRYVSDKDWRNTIIKKLCEYYPDAIDREKYIYIPSLDIIVSVPEITFPKL